MHLVVFGQSFEDVFLQATEERVRREVGGKLGGREEIDKAKSQEFLENFVDEKIRIIAGSSTNVVRTIAILNNRSPHLHLRHVTIMGNDDFKYRYHKIMNDLGIKFDIKEIPDLPTGQVFCFITKGDKVERTMRTLYGSAKGSMATFIKKEKITQRIQKADTIHCEGYLLFDGDVVETLADRSSGKLFSFDCASFEVVKHHYTRIWNLLQNKKIGIFFANELEVKKLFKGTYKGEADACTRLKEYCQYVLVTMGEKGCYYIGPGMETAAHCPAHHVEEVIDVTGAGDSFAGAFLWALSHNKPLPHCVAIASRVAAEVVKVMGSEIQQIRLNQLLRDIL